MMTSKELTKIREEKKLSKSDFAKLLEITPMLLGKYEKGSILKAGQKNCYKG